MMPKARSRSLNVIEHRRHLPQVLRKSAIPDQVADDAKQLRQHHANHLGPGRDLDTGQLLHCREIGQVVHHAAQVIDAIGVWDVGVPGLALTHLFGAAMMEADLGNGVDDLFAIELHHNAQDTVRARMLRTHVEKMKSASSRARLMPHSSGRKRSASCSASSFSGGN